jgi:hypothetical protein
MIFDLKPHVESFSATAENVCAERNSGGKANHGRKGASCLEPMKTGESYTLLEKTGHGIIRRIWCTIPPGNTDHLRNVMLRIYWNGLKEPSVEVPLGDFFGIAHGRQKAMQSACVSMQDGRGLNCFFPMPFEGGVRIVVTNEAATDVPMFFYQIDFTMGDTFDQPIGYFHAQFRRTNPTPLHQDYVVLDGIEGNGCYAGTVLGIRNCYSTNIPEWWGEGEVKFYIDGEEWPSICGTGLEDYIGSGWGTEQTCTPYQGAPLLDNKKGYYSLYRFHILDPIYFHHSLRVTVSQLGSGSRERAQEFYGDAGGYYKAAGCAADAPLCLFERSDDYCSVAYWYQSPPIPSICTVSAHDRLKNI